VFFYDLPTITHRRVDIMRNSHYYTYYLLQTCFALTVNVNVVHFYIEHIKPIFAVRHGTYETHNVVVNIQCNILSCHWKGNKKVKDLLDNNFW
jgi:hypothetical protein